jgi:hypothetical protein
MRLRIVPSAAFWPCAICGAHTRYDLKLPPRQTSPTTTPAISAFSKGLGHRSGLELLTSMSRIRHILSGGLSAGFGKQI